MSRWSSECAIVRDLTRAQGAAAGLAPRPRPLRSAERPPRRAPPEATEEEYFARGAGGDAPPRPELGLIRQMLNMVRERNVSDDLTVSDVALISKLDPRSPEFFPTIQPQRDAPISPKDGKTKKMRNVAMESILRLRRPLPAERLTGGPAPPRDVDADLIEEDTTVEKVNNWLTNIKCASRTEPCMVILESTNMFKKKSKPAGPTSVRPLNTQRGLPAAMPDRPYEPSAAAHRYYRQYLDKSQLMDSLNDDIWTKAEKQMKQIYENRRLAAAENSLQRGDDSGTETEEAPEEPEADKEAEVAEERDALNNEDMVFEKKLSFKIEI